MANDILAKLKRIDNKHHFFTVIAENFVRKPNLLGRLSNISISVKDNICVKGVESRAGSAILNGYKPIFNATAVQRIINEGGTIIGKTSMDEFGFGSFSVNVGNGFKVPLNPHDTERVCGGSSGGSAGITALCNFPHISLAESTGGSIAAPAAFCGVVGLCPTYGAVSRYGLIDYANSLDKIGPMARTVEEAELLYSVIAGRDPKDTTSVDIPIRKKKKPVIGIIDYDTDGVEDTVVSAVESATQVFSDNNIQTKKIKLPITYKYGIPAYYLISMSEASTNLAKYCGLRYGASETMKGDFHEYFTTVRSRNFGKEAKRRIILGTFARMSGYRDKFYLKAAQVRAEIIKEYKNAFQECTALFGPSMPIVAPKIKDVAKLTPLQHYRIDQFTVGPNLAGLPHISVPVHRKGLPIGGMLIGNHFEEQHVIELAKTLQND